MIYFITDGEYTKIGVADDPHKRLRELQTGNARELTLICSIDGSYELERKLHKVLGNWRVLGEWFDVPIIDNEELALFISHHYEEKKKRQRRRKKTVFRMSNYMLGEYLSIEELMMHESPNEYSGFVLIKDKDGSEHIYEEEKLRCIFEFVESLNK